MTRMQSPAGAALRRALTAALLAAAAACFSACDQKQETPAANTNANSPQPSAPAAVPAPTPGQKPVTAVVETDFGTIKMELLTAESPKTAENFRQLAERGFYNGLTFHRIISNFMIQGGDPKGDGTGGQTATGQSLPNEINMNNPLYQGGYRRGLVAMANKGLPQTASSQFFIMHQTKPLQPGYTIFARVTQGMEVVDKIAAVRTTGPENSTPVSKVVMKRVYIQQ